MRLHKPAGYYAFYFPHLFGTFLAAAALSDTPPSFSSLLTTCVIHAVSNLFLRGWACTYNDALDAPFDRQVERCRTRPVARGAVSPFTAHCFAAVQAAVWILITLFWLPQECILSSCLFAITMAIYPFCKRVTNFPQVVLGFSLALGQGIGIASLGVRVNPTLPHLATSANLALTCLYMSNVVNAVVYDTVYAHQDLKDDLKVGVMSMAVACQGQTKVILSLLSMLEITLLASTGVLLGFRGLYWVFTVGGTAAVLGWMLMTVNLDEPKDCWKWFKWCIWFTGGTVCTGLLAQYLAR
jgi:4-hydroxybenzoate polyprenyltransferase